MPFWNKGGATGGGQTAPSGGGGQTGGGGVTPPAQPWVPRPMDVPIGYTGQTWTPNPNQITPSNPIPGNTGIVPPHMQQAQRMYRQFIRGRLGMGGNPQPMGGHGIEPFADRPQGLGEIKDMFPQPEPWVDRPQGGMGAGDTPYTPPIERWVDRPYGGGAMPYKRSLYNEIG